MFKWMFRTLLAALSMALFCSSAQAQPKTVAAGKCSTQIVRSKACRGVRKGLARDIAASVLAELSETKSYRVVGAKVGGASRSAIDLLMTVDVLCFEDHLEVNFNLVDMQTTATVWAKTNSLSEVAQVQQVKKRVVQDLVRFGSDSGSKTKPRANSGHTLAVVPIQAGPGVLDEKTLGGLTDLLWSKLSSSGRFHVLPRSEVSRFFPKGSGVKPVDHARVYSAGGVMGTERAVFVQVLRTGKQCSVSWALLDVSGHKSLSSGTQKSMCTGKSVGQSLTEIADKLGG